MSHIYGRMKHRLESKPVATELTMTMPAREWWTIVVALETASEALGEEPPEACQHFWKLKGDTAPGSYAWWYQCQKCGRFSR
jgi:hypothetical protein